MADGDKAGWPEGFGLSHFDPAAFRSDGLRPFFAYRDLDVKRATGGKVVANVIKANGTDMQSEWHWHDVDFQVVYILKGWIEFEYKGVGFVRLEAGTCVTQAPRIHHREIAHSKDLELIEIVGPADFATHLVAERAD